MVFGVRSHQRTGIRTNGNVVKCLINIKIFMKNNISFDSSRYIELLKKEEILKNKGIYLFNENRASIF